MALKEKAREIWRAVRRLVCRKSLWIRGFRGLAALVMLGEVLMAGIYANEIADLGDHGVATSHVLVWIGAAALPVLLLGIGEYLDASRALLPLTAFHQFGVELHRAGATQSESRLADADLQGWLVAAHACCAGLCRQIAPLVGARPADLSVDLMIILPHVSLVAATAVAMKHPKPFRKPYGAKADGPGEVGLDGLTDHTTGAYLAVVAASTAADRHATVLRVPRPSDDQKVLPGAPKAMFELLRRLDPSRDRFAEGGLDYDNVNDTHNIEPSRYGAETTEAVRRAVAAYFVSQVPRVRSFVSVALAHGGNPVGVVNIDWTKTGLFADRARQHLVLGTVRAYAPLLETASRGILVGLERAHGEREGPGGGGSEPAGNEQRRA